MKKNVDLLNGPVVTSMARLAIPIMATSMITMAYNLIDMVWVGHMGSNAVAAIGSAGLYMWSINALAVLTRMGGQVLTGQALGAGDGKKASSYATTAFQMVIIFALLSGLICIIFANPLIGFFKLNQAETISDAVIYVRLICGLAIFSFLNQIFTGLFTAMGNSRSAFMASTIGLVLNIILDPILIFGFGPVPAMKVMGAAIATVFSQFIVTVLFIAFARKDQTIFHQVKIFSKMNMAHAKEIVHIGLPTALENVIFNIMLMVVARFTATFGDAAIAVQKVGSQIESISWMMADGFAAAISAFVAQNYGADNKARIRKGYFSAMLIVLVWGIFCTFLLMVFPAPLFKLFITEKAVIPIGVSYLTILGTSQAMICLSIATTGAFSGFGNTLPPAVISSSCMLLRIPLAYYLCHSSLGLDGIWWSIVIIYYLRTLLTVGTFLVFLRQKTNMNA